MLNYVIIALYFAVIIGIGIYYLRRQTSIDEYYVGNRKVGPIHVGLSVIATDVGGGFSIGLGGLGFAMGLSGSWLLFSGLVGAWLSAVIMIPKIKMLGDRHGFLTYPDFLKNRYDKKTYVFAAVVSGIGYAGFVGAQILAGAKLSVAAFDISLETAIFIMAAIVILYTAFGGLEAVIATDIVQWLVLLVGLLFVALPFAWIETGGWAGLVEALPETHFSMFNLTLTKFLTWMITIIPIWFVGMTLYQRIYSSRDVKSAKKAWYLAGLLEWPLMAFTGVLLGMFARVMFPDVDSEMGLPLLIKNVLPIGISGLVLAAYFSAIMSTADSCLIASVGNFTIDFYRRFLNPEASEKKLLFISRLLTFVIGISSVLVALFVPAVLDAIMISYSFMVGGLFAPTLFGILWKRTTSLAAFSSMTAGCATILVMRLIDFGVEPILISVPLSIIVLVVVTFLQKGKTNE